MVTLNNSMEIAQVLDNKKALLVLHIGPQFERQLNAGQVVPVQVLVDGRNSNMAGAASGYASSMIDAFPSNRLRERGIAGSAVTVSSRAWFNPNLETRWNIISGMLAVLAVVQVILLSGQSVAGKRNKGRLINFW